MKIIVAIVSGVVAVAVLAVTAFLTQAVFLPTWAQRSEDTSFVDAVRMSSFLTDKISNLSLFPGLNSQKQVIAVVVENHELARPHHTGLEKALMIEEYLVEGLISRFVVVFDRNKLPEEVGPVRSLRPYFLDGLLPEVHFVFHAGGSPEALQRVQSVGSGFQTVNGLWFDDGDTFYRKDGIAAPHDLFIDKAGMESQLADARESMLQPIDWPPYEIGALHTATGASVIELNFFNPNHNVTYTYQPLSGTYERDNGGIISPTQPRNLLILEAPILGIGEYGRLKIDLVGSGPMTLFHSGRMQAGTWRRATASSSFEYLDDAGEPIHFAKGQTWRTVLPTMDRLSWE